MTTAPASNRIAEWTKAWAERSGVQLWYASETASTNAVAREDFGASAKSKLAPVLYLTGHQTSGRGRGANTWTDAEGALLSSWSFPLKKSAQPILGPLAGLAVFQAASKAWPALHWSIKAPNDIYLGDKKIAGILIEAIESGDERRVVVGLGMNVLSSPKPMPTATCLAAELGGAGPTNEAWNEFLKTLLIRLIAAVNAGQNRHLSASDAKTLCEALNRRPGLSAKIEKVGPSGELHTATGIVDWHTL